MKKANRIVSFDWSMYDQGHVVYRPAKMTADELRIGLGSAYERFYTLGSIGSRFPLKGKRHRTQWLIYNLFMRRASQTENIEFDRGADAGARCRADAAHPADKARMARRRARGGGFAGFRRES